MSSSDSEGSHSPARASDAGSSVESEGPGTPPNLHQNSIDPSAKWLVQKYGGTSVGKFAAKIAEDIIPRYLDQHKIAIVCSARSGTTKALGTTNLLLKAASQTLGGKKPAGISHERGVSSPGTNTPLSIFWGKTNGAASPPCSPSRTRDRQESVTSNGSPTLNASVPVGSSQGSVPPLSLSSSSSSFGVTVDLIQTEHVSAARANVRTPEILQELEAEIESDCEGLKAYLAASQIIDEISPRSRDNIVGVGEKLACKLVAAILRDRGIDSEYVSLENIVPEFEDGDHTALSESSLPQEWYDRVAEAVGERVRQCGPRVPVVTGFFGPVPGSLLHQIGRGYTDLLAALLSVGLEASEMQIWKEVDGIFTADPRKVPTARLIPIISPEEAAELTYYGSEVVHPFTMEQVVRRKIPIRIKNVENPEGGGTVIHPSLDVAEETIEERVDPVASPASDFSLAERKRLPTAVTYKENIIVLNVNSNRKSVSHGFLAGIFTTLDRFGVVVDLISTSEVHVSMAIGDTHNKKSLDKFVKELRKIGTVSVHNDMAILSLVGKHMHKLVGIAGRMFSTLAEGNVNIEMISQGASEINISCVIQGKDAVKALNMIHQSCLQIRPDGARGRSKWISRLQYPAVY
ncbi:aspartate kinase [Sistotremastrum niveocremeum HHB9708]|uniref:aspartate kinase n=1 Tax=Sistotremastrum niveocremeum HHB9708 TaxID=1314777 RepID=A0A164YWD8_9AGAM|nr:aspartate kinase [Sistotremastrum niveocremeum HHB9708]